ncbi:Mimitin, mitochondrial, partial [Tetrabaena socialis]
MAGRQAGIPHQHGPIRRALGVALDWVMGKKAVGKDSLGNVYYRWYEGSGPGRTERREVQWSAAYMYYDPKDIPAEWRMWLRKLREEPPTDEEMGQSAVKQAAFQARVAVVEEAERLRRLRQQTVGTPDQHAGAQPDPVPLAALPGSSAWWALRCVRSHQAALDGRSHSLLTEASQAAALCGVLHIELALLQYGYGYVEGGRQYLARAGELLGLEPGVTAPAAAGGEAAGATTTAAAAPAAAGGAEAGAAAPLLAPREWELVLNGVGSVLREGVNGPASGPALWGCLARYWALKGQPDSAKESRLKQVRGLAGGAFKSDPARFEEYGDASEALCRAYLEGHAAGRPGGYSGVEQALLLAWATAVKQGTSSDDLQEWQMAPWVEAVLSQRRSRFMAAAAARLLKTRHERDRPRTRERALLHMDQLAEALAGVPPPEQQPAAATAPSPPPSEPPAAALEGTAGAEAAVVGAEAVGAEAGAVAAPAPSAEALAGQRSVLSWAVWFPLQ